MNTKSDVVSVKLDKNLRDILKKIAAIEGKTISELNNEVVRTFSEDYQRITGFNIPIGPLLKKPSGGKKSSKFEMS